MHGTPHVVLIPAGNLLSLIGDARVEHACPSESCTLPGHIIETLLSRLWASHILHVESIEAFSIEKLSWVRYPSAGLVIVKHGPSMQPMQPPNTPPLKAANPSPISRKCSVFCAYIVHFHFFL